MAEQIESVTGMKKSCETAERAEREPEEERREEREGEVESLRTAVRECEAELAQLRHLHAPCDALVASLRLDLMNLQEQMAEKDASLAKLRASMHELANCGGLRAAEGATEKAIIAGWKEGIQVDCASDRSKAACSLDTTTLWTLWANSKIV